MTAATYLLALGSNRPRSATRPPRRLVAEAMAALDAPPCRLLRASPIIATPPLGPARRRFANAAALVETMLSPPALLHHLKRLEEAFGRKRGQRWGDRPLDLDIILWSRGRWTSPGLTVPHRAFRDRDFVLVPLHALAPHWRDPVTGLRVRHLLHRLQKAAPRAKTG